MSVVESVRAMCIVQKYGLCGFCQTSVPTKLIKEVISTTLWFYFLQVLGVLAMGDYS